MMKRIPEPELMDDPAQAAAYAAADFSEANGLFLDLFARHFPDHTPVLGIDLGCGPGDITIAFARRHPGCQILGIDGSEPMLTLARKRLAASPDVAAQVRFGYGRLPGLALAPRYDTLLSNSLLHHLPDPLVLWHEIQRLGRPGAAVLVMDLVRPASEAAAKALVQHYAAGAPAILQRDFFHSLRAAYTLDEVAAQVASADLRGFEIAQVSDRHWAVWGRLP